MQGEKKIISYLFNNPLASTVMKIGLGTIVVLLAYFGLYANISNEIYIRKVMDERKDENIQKLKDLREIQIAYKTEKGYYADNPDSALCCTRINS